MLDIINFARDTHDAVMESDRDEVDLGLAVDVEEKLAEAAVLRQPKKRFVGRRQAEEKAAKENVNGSSIEDSGAIQGGQLHNDSIDLI